MKKRSSIILGCVLILIFALIVGLVSCNAGNVGTRAAQQDAQGQNADAQDEAAEAGSTVQENEQPENDEDTKADGEKMCLITINNGAASANTDYAVNGLHVYDPTTEDMDDFVSGAEVPVGTEVTVYVYNLASPVELSIVHNGVTVAERTYSVMTAWEDDDKVEFFELTLEGDLTVTTTALPNTAETGSTLHINGDSLGTVEIGSEQLHNGDTLRNGTYDITVKRQNKDVDVSLQIGDKTVGTATLTAAAPTFTFKDVTVNNQNVTVTFKDRTAGTTETTYAVTIEDRVRSGDVTMTVGYVDDSSGTPKAVEIVSGQKYDRGLYIGVRAVNRGSRSLKLTAYGDNGAVLQSVEVAPMKGTIEGANGFYITLDQAVRFVLEYADSDTPAPTPTPTPAPTPAPTPTPIPTPEPEEYTITINNGASSADIPGVAVNAIHVYDLDEAEMPDLESGAKKPAGTRIEIYAYNLASPIHLTVVHNGETIKDVDYDLREAWVDDDKIEFIDLTLEGDLIVTTEAIEAPAKVYTVTFTGDTADKVTVYDGTETLANGAEIEEGTHSFYVYNEDMDDEIAEAIATLTVNGKQIGEGQVVGDGPWTSATFENVTVDGDVVIDVSMPEEEETKEYTVTVEDSIQSADVTVTVGWIDVSAGVPKNVDVVSGSKYPKGLMIGGRVMNNGERAVVMTVYEGGKQSFRETVAPGAATGYYIESLSADSRFVFEYAAEEKPETYTVTIRDSAAAGNTEDAVNGLHVYNAKTFDDIASGDKLEAGTEIELYVYNLATPVHLTVEHKGEIIVDKDYPVFTPYVDDEEFINVVLEGDLVITTSLLEEETKEYTVTVEDSIQSADVTVTVGWIDVSEGAPKNVDIVSGSKYPEGLMIGGRVMNNGERAVVMTVYEGEEQSFQETVAPGGATGYYIESLSADSRFVFAYAPVKTYTVTLTGDGAADATIYNEDYDFVRNGDEIAEGTHSFHVLNEMYVDGLDEALVTLTVNGKQIGETVTIAEGADFEDVEVDGDVVIDVSLPEKETLYTITINNGASSANIPGIAVNAIHVYDLDEAEMPDLESGAKKPAGTRIEIYAYNLASPIHLTVVHNGETIKDVDYDLREAWVDDDKIEFIDLTLEGDLIVTTEAIEAPAKVYTVTFTGDTADKVTVYDGTETLANGAEIEEGVHSFYVYNEDMDDEIAEAIATLTVNGKQIGEGQVVGDGPWTSATFENVTVDGDVVIDVTLPASEQYYTVSLEDKIGNNKEAKFTLYYKDENGKWKTIDTGEKILAGTKIRAAVPVMKVARGDVQVTLLSGDTVIGVYTAPKPEAKPLLATYIPSEEGMVLESDLKAVLEYAPEKAKTYTVTFTGDAADKVTVYDGTEMLASGAEIAEGTHSFYVYNEDMDDEIAEAIATLTVNGKQIGEGQVVGDGPWTSATFENVTVDGDVVIDVSLPEEEETKEYTVTVENKIQSADVTVTVGWIDISGGVPKNVDIVSGSKYPEGLMIGGRVMNNGERAVVMTVYEGGKQSFRETVAPGAATGYYIESLSADSRFVFAYAAEEGAAVGSVEQKEAALPKKAEGNE